MSEGSIPLNADHDAIHLAIKRIIAGRGVGVGQLTVELEISPAKPSATRLPLWIEGSIRTTNLGQATGFLTRLHGVNGPTSVPDLGGRRSIMLEVNPAQVPRALLANPGKTSNRCRSSAAAGESFQSRWCRCHIPGARPSELRVD